MTRRILLTGGPGFGKSSIITEFEHRGLVVFHEISRQIIQDSLAHNLRQTPWENISRFSELVEEGRIAQHRQGDGLVAFYDRGLPDIAGFLLKDKQSITPRLDQLCNEFRYFHTVFITPPWEAIYQRDHERHEDFMSAIKVHKALEQVYTNLGYQLIPVPMGSIRQRADFILNHPVLR
jgi:predicted ATPase